MALVKCKECGGAVSTKAKACPTCGAKVKKTSAFTWLVLLLLAGYLVAEVAQQSKPRTESISSGEVDSKESGKPAPKPTPPKPAWTTSTSKDEMTGKFSAHASSPTASPKEKMSFPYHDVVSWMGIGCNGEKEWAYIGFSDAPNLTNDETKNGYNLVTVRMKWDDKVFETPLRQEWGSKFLGFESESWAISHIAASSTGMLELRWYGEQPTYFEYSFNGSTRAIQEIRAKCAKAAS